MVAISSASGRRAALFQEAGVGRPAPSPGAGARGGAVPRRCAGRDRLAGLRSSFASSWDGDHSSALYSPHGRHRHRPHLRLVDRPLLRAGRLLCEERSPEHRKASFWHGAAARDLALGRQVKPKLFESILAGFVPGTDRRLGRARDGEHQHRPGVDITFSAPKSVSLQGLVREDARIVRAHDEAVRATLDMIERDLLITRVHNPETGKRERRRAQGMVAATFRHLASRNLDPQLHTHAVLANMTQGPRRLVAQSRHREAPCAEAPDRRPLPQ